MQPTFNRHEPDFDVLHRVSEGLFTFVTRFQFGEIPLHNRSLIVHVPTASSDGRGSLVIINPAELSASIRAAIEELEQQSNAVVRYLISPGDWHHLFIEQHARAFPHARAHVPPGRIPAQSPAYEYATIDVLADNPFPELAPHLQISIFRGLVDFLDPARPRKRPRYELVFHHPASRTITSGDVLYYSGADALTPEESARGLHLRTLGFHFLKWQLIGDPQAVARSLERILQWDFAHYISIHGGPGNMLEREAKAHIESLLTWAKAPPTDG